MHKKIFFTRNDWNISRQNAYFTKNFGLQMAYISFDLSNAGSLHTMASAGAGIAGTLPPGMAAIGGLYLIFHAANNNRYIGKSGNLRQRFEGRMLTVNELGLG